MTDTTDNNIDNEQHPMMEHITIDLTAEIGRTTIKISELLDLAKGVILPLEQGANEPINIYANDKLIAKGHIIAANGKYSIKIL